jgi:hypothetical protein
MSLYYNWFEPETAQRDCVTVMASDVASLANQS